jgi:hypothetical protein
MEFNYVYFAISEDVDNFRIQNQLV